MTGACTSRRTFRFMGVFTGLIGLGASGVACWFFLLGLQQHEQDAQARAALAVAGVLMTLAQVAAFGLHGLLPAHAEPRLRRMLLGLAVVLLAFEVLTMSLMQWTSVRNAEQAGRGAYEQAQQLRQAIDSRRATVSALREAAAVQARSIFPASRQSGLQALADAARIEAEMQPLLDSLAKTAAAPKATAIGLLGEREAAAFVVLRSVLISVVGLLMMSTAGRLLSRGDDFALDHKPDDLGGLFLASADAMLPETHALSDRSAPAVPVSEQPDCECKTVTPWPDAPLVAGQIEPVLVCSDALAPRATAAGPAEDRRYLEVREGVLAGRIRPSVREIRAAVGGATAAAQGYLAQLEADQVVRRRPAPSQGYALVASPPDAKRESVENSRGAS